MTRLIKKYKNRRLYDTEISQYVTIEDLHRYVIEDILFRVEDSNTSTDLTNNILLQILVEMESGTTKLLSTGMLRQVIHLAQHPMSKSLQSMLEKSMTMMEKQFKSNDYISEVQKAGETMNEQMLDVFKQWQDFLKNTK